MLLQRSSRAARNINSWKRKWTRWAKIKAVESIRVYSPTFFHFIFCSAFFIFLLFLLPLSFSFPLFLWPWRGRVYLKTCQYRFPSCSFYVGNTWTETYPLVCILWVNKARLHSSPCQNFSSYHRFLENTLYHVVNVLLV